MRPTWALVSSDDRPDVMADPGEGLAFVRCVGCGEGQDIDLPVLVVRPEHPLQVLFGFPDSFVGREDAPGYEELLTEAGRAYGGRMSGWHLLIPRVLLGVALVRDTMADIADVEGACAALIGLGGPLVEWYRTFLTLAADVQARGVADALWELWQVPPEDLTRFLRARPELGSDAAVEAARFALRAGPPEGKTDEPLRYRVELVEALHRGEPVDQVAERFLQSVEEFGGILRERMQEMLGRLNGFGPGDASLAAIEAFREAWAHAQAIGAVAIEAGLVADLIARLLRRDAPAAVEEALNLGTRALTLPAPDGVRMSLLTNLSSAYARRSTGDLGENWNSAHVLLREALDGSDREGDPRNWALVRNNLAYLLYQRPGRTLDDLRAALGLVREGLLERSPEKDVVDWAYSQLYLAMTLNHIRAETPDDTEGLAAIRATYEEALRHLRPEHDRALWLTMKHNLADALLLGETADPARARAVVETAAAEVSVDGPTGVPARLEYLRARIAAAEQGPTSEAALAHRRQALDLLDLVPDPDLFLTVSAEMTDMYGRLERWSDAADTYERSAADRRRRYEDQVHTASRHLALGTSWRAARWAAYCMVRAGRPARALELLEEGCARQLSETVGRSTADLAELDATLRRRWLEATAGLRETLHRADSSLIGADRTHAVQAEAAVRQVLAEIRAVPGLEGFLLSLTCADIAAAGDGLPVIYVANAPSGSVVLGIGADRDVRAIEVPEVTSMDVLHVVVIDDDSRPTLLLAQDSAERLRDLPAALDRLVELSPLARAIENMLAELGGEETVLVPTGLLGMLPLHALPTTGDRCLDDVMGLRLAPSAAVYAASTRRIGAQRTPRLLAVADTRTLLAAQYEVRQLHATFAGATTILENATRNDVLAAARDCTHVHFACHGDSALGDTVASGLRLADARLTVDDLLDGRLTDCRLAVASACQSGHYPLTATTDDFTGLAAGFLQAGAAAAVVSLWQVADLATAILMSYFYEQLDAHDPPAALRKARRWLRDLSREDADDYLRSHPALAPLAERLPKPPRPYKSPVFWAAFHCYGR